MIRIRYAPRRRVWRSASISVHVVHDSNRRKLQLRIPGGPVLELRIGDAISLCNEIANSIETQTV